MKIVRRLVEIIGDAEWVDRTVDASLDGLGIVMPTRLIRSTTLTEEKIPESEVARMAKTASPLSPKRPSAVRISYGDTMADLRERDDLLRMLGAARSWIADLREVAAKASFLVDHLPDGEYQGLGELRSALGKETNRRKNYV